ncbi:epoxide hydrolase [Chrysochromulina tobinii]|uniref:Epoxide hydrolase n=1 Tax=Chrysochromulina tobinii TaxID=1460289 RepID=A0A0M0JGW1_9EUKA|nr:epoxide hydrolase [Chrysochromulina tobinii]|eukprot:KOO25448.1 epoxide hydrolase [Chrysochromulina sp. CCMP291]
MRSAFAPGITCIQLFPYQDRDLFFDCAVVNTTASPKGNVYFMHGNDGPYSKGMWSLMMQTLAGRGYNTLACDQRGYSPGASPYNVSDYNYDYLAQDLFALVDCHFGAGTEFHVVAHDQGSRVAFHSIAVSSARSRFASYTTLSIPHTDVFSDELFGPNQNPTQAINFQYLWALTLPGESVKAYNASIYHSLCTAYGYTAPEACQTAIWWYTGAVESGALGMPPLTDDWGPIDLGIPVSYVKEHTPYPLEGSPQRVKVGLVTEFPILYICGEHDTADVCNDQARNGSAELIANFSYMRVPGRVRLCAAEDGAADEEEEEKASTDEERAATTAPAPSADEAQRAERAAGLQATEEPSTGTHGNEDEDEDEEEDLNAVAAMMLDEESALQRASTARLAVLRACPLFAEEGTAAAEFDSLLGDAIGLQELVAEYLADLDALPVRRPSRAVDPSQALAAMLPPASSVVQLTHTADLAGAAVFALLAGLQGAFHVCAAPLTMQRLFDGLSRRKEWERIVLPASAHDGANSGSAHYSTDKLEAAGYRLLHPRLLHDGAPTDEDLRGVVRRTPETAGAGSGPVSSSRDNSRDHAPDVPPEHD